MRDENLKGESFCFVHSVATRDPLSGDLMGELRECDGVALSEHAGTVTLVCSGIVGLGELIRVATDVEDEGGDFQFCGKLRRALADRIG